jgi:cobalamin synthase
MRRRAVRRGFWVLVVVLSVLLALTSPPAIADTSNIGRNLGNEVRSWATALLLGVAVLVGLPILFRRDVSAGLVLVLLVIVVGGFVFAPTAVREVIRGLSQANGV